MKIVNWNIEWMNRWFSGNAMPIWSSTSLSSDQAQTVARKVANVIRALDPDILSLQEGPSALAEMQLFLAGFLSDATGGPLYEPLISADGGAQKLYVMRKIGGQAAAMDYATDPLTQALRDGWQADVNGDLLLETYEFTRLPLIVDIDPVGGQPLRLVVLHTKSKYVHNGEAMFTDPDTRQTFIAEAMQARRRISAEAFRLRTYLDAVLADDLDARVIVTGDFNDGPGRDFFERSYLTHNVTDILLGSTFYPELIFGHPLIGRVDTPALFTARFDDFVDNVQDRPLLLDHFVVSPALADYVRDAGIAHDAFEAELDRANGHRVERPSDHRPIWVEIGAPLAG
ncbi:endonuclease/exonuclease/phosphatase family protein [Actibacterium sp. D379-3]